MNLNSSLTSSISVPTSNLTAPPAVPDPQTEKHKADPITVPYSTRLCKWHMQTLKPNHHFAVHCAPSNNVLAFQFTDPINPSTICITQGVDFIVHLSTAVVKAYPGECRLFERKVCRARRRQNIHPQHLQVLSETKQHYNLTHHVLSETKQHYNLTHHVSSETKQHYNLTHHVLSETKQHYNLTHHVLSETKQHYNLTHHVLSETKQHYNLTHHVLSETKQHYNLTHHILPETKQHYNLTHHVLSETKQHYNLTHHVLPETKQHYNLTHHVLSQTLGPPSPLTVKTGGCFQKA
jgi:hypothetical protein